MIYEQPDPSHSTQVVWTLLGYLKVVQVPLLPLTVLNKGPRDGKTEPRLGEAGDGSPAPQARRRQRARRLLKSKKEVIRRSNVYISLCIHLFIYSFS